jgi:uncharacterized protein YybS (DUF2232 family)
MIAYGGHMNTKTRALSEAALITALICIIGLAGMYIPLISILAYINFVPLIILGKRHGLKYAATSLVAASIIIGMFAGPLYALTLMFLSGTSSVIMGWLLNLEKKPYTVLGAGVLAALISTVVVIALGQLVTGIPMMDTIQTVFDESSKMQSSMLNSLGTDPTAIEAALAKMKQTKEQVLLLIPGALVIWAVLSTAFNYWLAAVILRKLRMSVPFLPPFREFALPKNVLMGTLIIYGLSMLATYMKIVDGQALMTNVQLLLIYTFAIQGLSVLLWYMRRRSIGKVFRIMIFIFLVVSSIGVMMLFMLGVSEVAFQFRKRASTGDQDQNRLT